MTTKNTIQLRPAQYAKIRGISRQYVVLQCKANRMDLLPCVEAIERKESDIQPNGYYLLTIDSKCLDSHKPLPL